MRIYKAIEAPPTCYLTEVAHWLAFGMFPEFHHDENGRDLRTSRDELLDHFSAHLNMSLIFEKEELEQFVPGVDYQKYIDSYMRSGNSTIAETQQRIDRENQQTESLRQKVGELDDAFIADRLQQHPKELEAAVWLNQILAPTKQMEDLARLQVFQALANGSLQASGLFVPSHVELEEGDCDRLSFETVAAAKWNMQSFHWESCNLTFGNGTFVGCQVAVKNMISLFPTPMIEPEKVFGSSYGPTFVPEADESSGAEKLNISGTPRRGRPPKGEGYLEKAVRAEFKRRQAAGDLSEKQEATIMEVIEWTRDNMGEEIGRTTAQRYLKAILN